MQSITTLEQAKAASETPWHDIVDFFRSKEEIIREISSTVVWFNLPNGSSHPITRTELKGLLKVMKSLEE